MKYPAFTLAVLAVLLSAVITRAADFTDEQYQKLEKLEFQTSDGQTLLYRLYKPEGLTEGQKYPLVVFLHGAGERGTDNELQVRGQDMFLHLIFSEEGQKNKAFLVAPQCPPKIRWTEGRGLDGTPLKQAHELVEQIKKSGCTSPAFPWAVLERGTGCETTRTKRRRPCRFAAGLTSRRCARCRE